MFSILKFLYVTYLWFDLTGAEKTHPGALQMLQISAVWKCEQAHQMLITVYECRNNFLL